MNDVDRVWSSDQSHPSLHCLTEWTVLCLSGSDITDLLNRLLTLNVGLLDDGKGDWTFLLNHRGRIQHAFWLVKANSDCYYAIGEQSLVSLIDSIDMFVFSEDVTLTLSSQRCVYRWGSSLGCDFAQQLSLSFDVPCFGIFGEQMILIDPDQVSHILGVLTEGGSSVQTPAQLDSFRIMKGSPATRDYAGKISPLDVSMKGVSEGKGCYPGQEVIERTLALGHPARVTMAAVIDGEPEILTMLDHTYQCGEEIEVYLRDTTAKSNKAVGSISSLTLLQTPHARIHAIIRVKYATKNKELCVRMKETSLDVILRLS